MVKIRLPGFRKIESKIMFWFIIIGVAPLLMVISLSYFAGREIIQRQILKELLQSEQERVNAINEFISDKKDDLIIFSSLHSLSGIASRFEDNYAKYGRSGGQTSGEWTQLKDEFAYFTDNNQYTGIHMITTGGTMLFSISGSRTGGLEINGGRSKYDNEFNDVFEKVKRTGAVSFSQYHYSDALKKNTMFVAGPVFGKDNKMTAVIVVEVNPGEINKLAANYIGLEKTGDTVIATKKGNEVVFLTDIRYEKGGALKKKLLIGSKWGLPIQNAVSGKNGSGFAIDYRGMPVLAVWEYIPELNWGIVVKMQADEAFAPLYFLRFVFIFILLGLIIIVVSGTVWVSREISTPIKKFTLAARELRAGSNAVAIRINSGDELGELAGAFNKMASDINIAVNELKLKTAELERSNTDLEQFAYAASHDLQEPLRTIHGYLQLLQERSKGRLDEELYDFINESMTAAKRMSALIRDLLEFSRVGKNIQMDENVDFNDVTDTACINLKGAIESSGAAVTHSNLPSVTADYSHMISLMQNLIGNAIKYRSNNPPVVRVEAVRNGNEYEFSVRDNGIGIDPKYFNKLFVVFQRLYTRDEYPGTGVGLAICKKIVERHGGRIWVESEPGQGSVFHFTIPVKKTNG